MPDDDAAKKPAPVAENSGDTAQRARGVSWRIVIWYPLIAVAAWYFTTHILRPAARGGLRPGETAPAFTALGWLNGDPPSAAELKGKVVVIDAWFAACPPCRRKAPELVELFNRFQARGVVFIGLTPDGEERLTSVRWFLEQTGITWPNGYGAVETLEKLLPDGGYFPSTWVVGPDGKVTWNEDSPGTLAGAIEEALSNLR